MMESNEILLKNLIDYLKLHKIEVTKDNENFFTSIIRLASNNGYNKGYQQAIALYREEKENEQD